VGLDPEGQTSGDRRLAVCFQKAQQDLFEIVAGSEDEDPTMDALPFQT
jgi:hypothetical protein